MDFETYYQQLQNCSSELLRERVTNEEYREEYRQACQKILEERECGTQQEPFFGANETGEEPLCDLNREIPSSLEECYKCDKISEALYNLSENVQKWGYVLLLILILTGVVLSVTGSFVMEKFYVGIFFTNILSWAIYAFVECGVFKVVALLLRALASIVHSNRITSNVVLYSASRKEN